MSSPPPLELRTVRDSDRGFLYDLYAQSRWDFQLVDWSSDAQREQMTRMQYDAQHKHYWKNYPESEHQIILRTDTPSPVRVGRIWTSVLDDYILLLDINIHPRHQDQGIGTAMLQRLKDRARDLGVPLRHSVEMGNEDALRLYKRLGFIIRKSTDTHYGMQWRPENVREDSNTNV